MKHTNNLEFNSHKITGWKCTCGETYYDPGEAQRILVLNKLRNEAIKSRLGRNRSNLILRLPKDVETALKLEKGKEVLIKIEGNSLRITPGNTA